MNYDVGLARLKAQSPTALTELMRDETNLLQQIKEQEDIIAELTRQDRRRDALPAILSRIAEQLKLMPHDITLEVRRMELEKERAEALREQDALEKGSQVRETRRQVALETIAKIRENLEVNSGPDNSKSKRKPLSSLPL